MKVYEVKIGMTFDLYIDEDKDKDVLIDYIGEMIYNKVADNSCDLKSLSLYDCEYCGEV